MYFWLTSFLIALMHHTPIVHAQDTTWTKVSSNDDSGVYYYINESSLRRSGTQYYAWVLEDRATERYLPSVKKNYLSYVSQWLIDCRGKKTKSLAGTFYEQRMQKGKTVASYEEGEFGARFEAVRPKTHAEAVLEFVCRNRESDALKRM